MDELATNSLYSGEPRSMILVVAAFGQFASVSQHMVPLGSLRDCGCKLGPHAIGHRDRLWTKERRHGIAPGIQKAPGSTHADRGFGPSRGKKNEIKLLSK